MVSYYRNSAPGLELNIHRYIDNKPRFSLLRLENYAGKGSVNACLRDFSSGSRRSSSPRNSSTAEKPPPILGIPVVWL